MNLANDDSSVPGNMDVYHTPTECSLYQSSRGFCCSGHILEACTLITYNPKLISWSMEAIKILLLYINLDVHVFALALKSHQCFKRLV